jgi:enoyl-CoA hydratase
MPYDTLLVDRDGPVLLATLNRPKALNALNRQLLGELSQLIEEIAADDSTRVVVITGAGERAFAAGADITEIAALGASDARTFATVGQSVFARLETLGKPVIAAVNGFALGGGCELAMACTFRVASETAVFGQPEIDLGLMPGFGGTQRLTRLVGRGRALDLVLTGRRITATEAERIGLASRVVAAASLRDEALALAKHLAAKAPIAVRYILAAVHEGADLPIDAATRIEAAYFGLVAATDDMREGTRAFVEKRTPVFQGR